jgi:hypothetical protein
MEFTMSTLSEYKEQADKFHSNYSLINALIPAESNKRELKLKSERKCRYCRKSMPETSFKSEAHLLPHFLGNNLLFSDFECDTCNKLFGTYEDHFCKMIEPERAVGAVAGKKKRPKFKSPQEHIRIEIADFYKNPQSVHITRSDVENDFMSLDAEKGKMVVKLKKNSFSRNKVYKYFLKLAISAMSEDVVTKHYPDAIEYILGNKLQGLQGCVVTGYSLPFAYNFLPHALLFEKRNESAKMPTHVVVLYCLNYVFALHLPLNKNDYWFYDENLTVDVYPPLFIQKVDYDNLRLHSFIDDYSSDELVKGLDQEITFEMNPNHLKNIVGIDPKTNNILPKKDLDPNDIKSIIILKNPDPLFNLQQEIRKSRET